MPIRDDASVAEGRRRRRSPDELAALVPWAGEGPDSREDARGVPPDVKTFRFNESLHRVRDSERGPFNIYVLDGTPAPFGPYLLPARFRIEPRDANGRPSRLPAIDVEVVDGRPRCYAIAKREDDLTGPLLRELPIESYIREASWRIARTRSRRKVAPRVWTLDGLSQEKVAEALKRRGPGVRLDTELLEQVAAVWRTADAANENTTQAVVDALPGKIAISTANRWIARARELGLIPPSRRTGASSATSG
jgi:transposase